MKGAIIFGSQSDLEKMKGTATCLKEFGVDYEAHVLSARIPGVAEFRKTMKEKFIEDNAEGIDL